MIHRSFSLRFFPLLLAVLACGVFLGGCAGYSSEGKVVANIDETDFGKRLKGFEELDVTAALPLPGRIQARIDSLSFDEYRILDAEDQLERRVQAKRWARRARESRFRQNSLDDCATAVAFCPYLPEAWLLYAKLLNDMGRYAQSRLCLAHTGRTLRYEPHAQRMRELIWDYHQLAAVVFFNLGQMQDSLYHAELALELEDSDVDLRLLYALCLGETGHFEQAREVLRDFEYGRTGYAQSLAAEAVIEMKAGNPDLSEDAFDRAFKYGMRGAIFENDRGLLYLETEDFSRAAEHFATAVDLLPSFLEARNNLGVAYRRDQKLEKATSVLLEALDLDPEFGAANFNLAEVYRQRMNDADELMRSQWGNLAYTHYTAAIAGDYQPEMVLERRASLALSNEEFENAEQDLLTITENPQISGNVLHLLGRVKKQQGQLVTAARLFEMAIQRGHSAPELHADYGEVLLRQRDLPRAVELLRKALELKEDLLVTRVNLSIALSQMGEYTQAETELKKAEALDPDHELVRIQRVAMNRFLGRAQEE